MGVAIWPMDGLCIWTISRSVQPLRERRNTAQCPTAGPESALGRRFCDVLSTHQRTPRSRVHAFGDPVELTGAEAHCLVVIDASADLPNSHMANDINAKEEEQT